MSHNLAYISPRMMVMGGRDVDELAAGGIFYLYLLSQRTTNKGTSVSTAASLHVAHAGRYKLMDLTCGDDDIEHVTDDDIKITFEIVDKYPITPGTPGSFEGGTKLCMLIDAFLEHDGKNVIVLFCKSGLGRSCMVAAMYLLHSGGAGSAAEAYNLVRRARVRPTHIDAVRLLNPSQLRMLYYYETLLHYDTCTVYTMLLTHVRMTTVPHFDASIVKGGCSPHLVVSVLRREELNASLWEPYCIYNLDNQQRRFSGGGSVSKKTAAVASSSAVKKFKHYSKDEHEFVDFDLHKDGQDKVMNTYVRGDVVLSFFSEGERMCQVCFNTAFVEDNYLCFDRDMVDLACDDTLFRTFDAGFKIEVFLSRVPDVPSVNIISDASSDQFENFNKTGVEAANYIKIDELFDDSAIYHE